MQYEGRMWRPPSEAQSYILQATIGCSHNLCTYCGMYRDKDFRVRELDEILEDIAAAAREYPSITKVFVADGDALVMSLPHWLEILQALREKMPHLRRVSCYATAQNVLEKSMDELRDLREGGLSLLYIGPESGDDETLRRIVKGATFEEHAKAAGKAHEAGIKLSVIMLLGAGGVERTEEHARESARLITRMDPEYLSTLTLSVIPGLPLHRIQEKGRFELPPVLDLLREMRVMVADSEPTRALFRTNHASNYLPIEGRLPRDRERIIATIDAALRGEIPLRPEYFRGL
ncbi:radical SAM protein [Candidatus Zixiibacteriota bacterium]